MYQVFNSPYPRNPRQKILFIHFNLRLSDSNLPIFEPILNGFIYNKKYKNPFKKGGYPYFVDIQFFVKYLVS